jgi:epoxyqueuosine reductase QueG
MLEERIRQWGRDLGFDAVAIAGTELDAEEARLAPIIRKSGARVD